MGRSASTWGARVGVVSLLAAAVLLPAATSTATASASVEESVAPLRVSLEAINPSVVPRTGMLTVRGEVTNADAQTWTDINVYTFLGDTPLADRAELDQSAEVGEDQLVGNRITDTGTEDRITSLQPGQSAPFRLRVPSGVLLDRLRGATGTARAGVYWFGVHALGADSTGVRDDLADGRARTFLPLLPTEPATPVATSVVVPLRAPQLHEGDGSLADLPGWSRRLALGGRLRDRIDFAASSRNAPVSWLVDPALLDAVRQIAGGNQPRSISPTDGEDAGGSSESPSSAPSDTSTGAPSPGTTLSTTAPPSAATSPPSTTPPSTAAPTPLPAEGSTTPGGGATAEPGTPLPGDPLDPEQAEAAEHAQAWLSRVGSVSGGDEILTLPYGDLDVAAALRHEPDLYDAARRRTSPDLERIIAGPETTTAAVVAPPSGYLDPTTLNRMGSDTLVLASDALTESTAPTTASVDGQAVVLASGGAGDGGPGPESSTGTLALRQRILGEATLRLLEAGPRRPDSLVVVMPAGWQGEQGAEFFRGLRVPGVRLRTLSQAVAASRRSLVGTPGVQIDPGAVVYPPREDRLALGELLFDQVSATRTSATTLENVLQRNSAISATVEGEVLEAGSYAARSDRSATRASLRATRSWLGERLGAVTIKATEGVTLSGASGGFAATVTNGLGEPVVVRVMATTDAGITIPASAPVELDPGAQSTVALNVESVTPGVHNVALHLVDSAGTSLPGSDVVPIRSAQVSNVIWLIMALGVTLIFSAIAVRAVRRLRSRRARA